MAITNGDLPHRISSNKEWRQVFIPTVFQWMGIQENPWQVPDAEVISFLNLLWKNVFPQLEHTIANTQDPVVKIVRSHTLSISI